MRIKKKKGFVDYYQQLKVKDVKAATDALMVALKITSLQSFRRYRDGHTEMRVSQFEAVRAVFEEFGIKDYRDE